ncbi:MAG: putative flavoprotein involved in K+ transport [Candidatus Tokpelaia sp. JSC161]|jgi:hypothetical protein|nr:MAG: putative flavoprotein involved in K+ transport [Candidatus Tokpelaia sp. JSC161]
MKQGADKDMYALEQRVKYDLSCLAYPLRSWVPKKTRKGEHVSDVLIIGGGQSGIALTINLLRECVSNVRIIDRNPEHREGPWRTFARMHTLRTPKNVIGPDVGIPSLSVKAWWEAKYGVQSWEEIERIPTLRWAEYLIWLKNMNGINIENNTEAYDIEPVEDGLLAVHLRKRRDEMQTVFARNVVLATGIEGAGQWMIPDLILKNIPQDFYAHTADHIPFIDLRGKRIAVIGAGASAFDNAAEALEHGAASVDLFVRRRELPTVNPYRWMESSGFLRHFGDLEDRDKWRFMLYLIEINQPPPQDTYLRVARFRNFTMHKGAPIENSGFCDKQIWLQVPMGRFEFDFLIVATGFKVNTALRPELKRLTESIAVWGDRYKPEKEEENALLADFPYMSSTFQFTEKDCGKAPYLKHIFSYTYGSMLSLAASAGISALKFGLARLVFGITRELFCADVDYHFDSLKAFNEKELSLVSEKK